MGFHHGRDEVLYEDICIKKSLFSKASKIGEKAFGAEPG
jgi:hypothetical protein